MKYFLLVGEKSGDLHGSNLIKSLKAADHDAIFVGYGGDLMQSEGMQLIKHYKEYSVMGFLEVIKNYFTIRDHLTGAVSDIQDFDPDVLILIDFGGFNMRVARKLVERSFRIVYYIPPKVWAWNTGRAKKLGKIVDQLLCILPFEPQFFKDYGVEATFVGNPVNDAINQFNPDPGFLTKHALEEETYVALLPGSRKQELEKVGPLFTELARSRPHDHFLLSAVSELDDTLYEQFRDLDNVKVIYNSAYDILSVSKAAIVTSGTATLETALLNVPQAVVYIGSAASIAIARRVIKVPYISLVNLIVNKPLVRELIQAEASLENLNSELDKLLSDSTLQSSIRDGYSAIRKVLGTGSASLNAAKEIIQN